MKIRTYINTALQCFNTTFCSLVRGLTGRRNAYDHTLHSRSPRRVAKAPVLSECVTGEKGGVTSRVRHVGENGPSASTLNSLVRRTQRFHPMYERHAAVNRRWFERTRCTAAALLALHRQRSKF